MNNSSLRKQLIITIIVMMLFVSSAIVWISIQAGTDAVNNLTQRVMLNVIERIGNENEHQLNEAMRALETIAPTPNVMDVQQKFPVDTATLEQRLWNASNLFLQTTSDIYFAGADNSFVGVHRIDSEHAHLFISAANDPMRQEFAIRFPGDRSRFVGVNHYDPRSRPWYLNAIDHDAPVWSDVYNSYGTHEPTITLSKAIYQPDHSLAGVAAIDITLNKLTHYLRSMRFSQHSVAFIVDSSGNMIASSGTDLPYELVNNQPKSKLAEHMANPLIKQAYLDVVRDHVAPEQNTEMSSKTINLDNEKIDVAYASLGNQFGLNWVSVVVVPRSDFMGGINNSVLQSIGIVVLFIVLALITGLLVIEHMLRDIRQLTAAALKIGNGEPLPRLHIHRKDEIGNLMKTFIEMENKLRFDRLTHVNNRDFLIAQIEFLQQHAESNPDDKVHFTLLFLDLDKFKAINDTYGHAAGDQLLIVIAARLKAAVRDTDTVARFGGDEFVVLLNGTSNAHDIQTTVDKIHALVEQPIALADHTVAIGVSIGWAIFPNEARSYSGLVDIADERMFSSKKEYSTKRLRLVD